MDILKRAIITEKMNKDAEKGIYGFIVDRDANKIEIGKAVKDMFNVEVEDVRTMRYLGKNLPVKQKGRLVEEGNLLIKRLSFN